MKCGLLGKKLGHSYSPQIHAHLGEYTYSLYEKEPGHLSEFLKSGDFHGINVTIPYKKAVIPFCSELSDIARKLGAINTIVRRSDGTLIGHNTDYFGFSSMVKRSGLDVRGKKVLVLGSGGASATAQQVLQELGADVVVISRKGDQNYDNLFLHSDTTLIVNCTPVGMYPGTGIAPLSLQHFPNLEGVLDLIYNPARTALLMEAEKRGLVAENGLWMLVAQAKESAEWFLGTKIPDQVIETVHAVLKPQMENIILIGMPGCGKSTIAKHLGLTLGKPVIDADTEIEKFASRAIPEIFSSDGEAEFRRIETIILSELGKKSGCIIATGGGCVTRAENYPLLHQNGSIIWIRRDPDSLPVDGRPLSKSASLQEMYRIRKPLYEAFSDFSVENNTTPEEAASRIIPLIKSGGIK